MRQRPYPATKKSQPTNMLNDLSAEISNPRQQLGKLQRQNEASRRKKLIPKPKGTAGRAPPKGYNLQDAMGLTEDRTRYNEFAAICRLYAIKYLEESKTIKDQNKLLVATVIRLAQLEHAFLARYKGGWPIYDFFSRYLRHRVAYDKKFASIDEELRTGIVIDENNEVQPDEIAIESDAETLLDASHDTEMSEYDSEEPVTLPESKRNGYYRWKNKRRALDDISNRQKKRHVEELYDESASDDKLQEDCSTDGESCMEDDEDQESIGNDSSIEHHA